MQQGSRIQKVRKCRDCCLYSLADQEKPGGEYITAYAAASQRNRTVEDNCGVYGSGVQPNQLVLY